MITHPHKQYTIDQSTSHASIVTTFDFNFETICL